MVTRRVFGPRRISARRARYAVAALFVAVVLPPIGVRADNGAAAPPVSASGSGDALFDASEQSSALESTTVKAALAAHPEHELVICLAGCKDGHGSVLWHRARRISSATMDAPAADLAGMARPERWFAGGTENAPKPAAAADDGPTTAPTADSIVCVAGCHGPVGVVVWRGMRLAWIRDAHKDDLMTSLRRLADRLTEYDAARTAAGAPRTWVAQAARDGLLSAFAVTDAPTATARQARSPVAASAPRS